jgi:hypothetical protein
MRLPMNAAESKEAGGGNCGAGDRGQGSPMTGAEPDRDLLTQADLKLQSRQLAVTFIFF